MPKTVHQIPEGIDVALKAEQVAQIMNVSIFTVHDWLRSGSLKGIKLRAQWRVMRSDLDEFVQRRRDATHPPEVEEEVEAEAL